jgi:very-short-patch-repair endonuclease
MVPGQLAVLARFQRGILTAAQARDDGMSKDSIRSRLRSGRWQQLHHGVYATFTGEVDRGAMLWAAVLRAGPGAALSHSTAAELYGLIDRPSALLHLTIPGDRRMVRIPGAVIHHSARAELARHPALTPPRTRLEETVIDLTQLATTAQEACDWVSRAVGRRLTTQRKLAAALDQRQRLRWRADLSEVLTASWTGVHSALENLYLRQVERRHRLPRGSRQVRVMRGTRSEYRDVLYEDYSLVVELDGRAAHPGDARWRDILRDNATIADGLCTLRYGWIDVSQRPCLVAAQVVQVLRLRGPVSAQPCSPGCPVL